MKRLLSMLSILLTVSPVTAATVGGAQLNPGQMIDMLTPVFNMIQTLIVTDISRTIITFILLFVVISKTLKSVIDKSPLKDSSTKISSALAGIVIISIFFRARNFLDKFSWIIIIAGLAWLILPLLGKIGGKLFKGGHGYHGDYGARQDLSRNNQERHTAARVEDVNHAEERNQRAERHALDNEGDTDSVDRQTQELMNALQVIQNHQQRAQ